MLLDCLLLLKLGGPEVAMACSFLSSLCTDNLYKQSGRLDLQPVKRC